MRNQYFLLFYSFRREFEETMDALQNDIETLEKEKGDMKKRLDAYSKKSLLADLARHATSSSSIAAVVAGTEIHADISLQLWKMSGKLFLSFFIFLFLPACGIRKRSKESEKFEREFFFFKSNFHLRVKSNVISLI